MPASRTATDFTEMLGYVNDPGERQRTLVEADTARRPAKTVGQSADTVSRCAVVISDIGRLCPDIDRVSVLMYRNADPSWACRAYIAQTGLSEHNFMLWRSTPLMAAGHTRERTWMRLITMR